MTSLELAKKNIETVKELLISKSFENAIELEQNVFFKQGTYLSIRNANYPKIRIYIEAPHFHLFDGLKLVKYYDDYQTSYPYSTHDLQALVYEAIKHLTEPDKRPVSKSSKPNKNVMDHFCDWELITRKKDYQVSVHVRVDVCLEASSEAHARELTKDRLKEMYDVDINDDEIVSVEEVE